MDPQRYNHLNAFVSLDLDNFLLSFVKLNRRLFSLSKYSNPYAIESLGRLVLLGFDITAFTPVAYLRHSL